jgi:FAD:protein FMN transferase
LNRHRIRAFSTTVEIAVSDHIFPGQLLDVYDFMEGAEKTFSPFRTDSELSWLNGQIGKEVIVSNEMYDVLQLAYQYYEETEGIFHPGILTLLEGAGYTQYIEHREDFSNGTFLYRPFKISDQPPYQLNAEHHKVTLFTKIDLGGIAKGWIVDQSVRILGDCGYGFINIGGDIRVFGELPRALHIGIEDPSNPENVVAPVDVACGGVATSSSMKRRWRVGGEWRHHLINPYTGKPTNSTIVSATVLAPTCTEADIWAKTVLMLGKEKGLAKAKENGQKAILIDINGTIYREGVI